MPTAGIADDIDSNLPVVPSGLGVDLDLETFSELSTLIRVRLRHQSKEEASSVRIAHAGNTQAKMAASGPGLDHDPGKSETATDPLKPHATTSQDSER